MQRGRQREPKAKARERESCETESERERFVIITFVIIVLSGYIKSQISGGCVMFDLEGGTQIMMGFSTRVHLLVR